MENTPAASGERAQLSSTERTTQTKLYGWYSSKYFSNFGAKIFEYEKPDGSRVHVCGVQLTEGPPNCGYSDARMVGEVTRFISSTNAYFSDISKNLKCLPDMKNAN